MGLLTAAALLWIYFGLRVRRQIVDTHRLVQATAAGQNVPSSLHPIIDPDACIGSLSCLKACPEGDILGLVAGKATLVEASRCIGHTRCAVECPVDAIRLVFGTKDRGVELPDTDEKFETSRPGVYVVGELGGMGLIKNAIRQGLQASEAVRARVASLPRVSTIQNLAEGAPHLQEVVDVVIVGAGPAGIATAVGCRQARLSFRILEQGTVGGSVANFPRGKLVMSEQVRIPGHGLFGRPLLSKEELIAELTAILRANRVVVEEGVRVTGLVGEQGSFIVVTDQGTVRARQVVLALGLRGTPRKLACPGEERTKVTYRLDDPEQYRGRRVLVVGGGDAAVEAAVQLAAETDAKVALSYRQESFSRIRPQNQHNLNTQVAAGRVELHLGTTVTRIDDDRVLLRDRDGDTYPLWNDHVIVAAGGELPSKMLGEMGVGVRTHFGEEKGRPSASEAKEAPPPADTRNRRFALVLAIMGTGLFVALSYVGADYYALPPEDREAHRLHELLRPAGLWGHGVGIVATLFMLSNFLYALRKRFGFLKGLAPIRPWLTFHMFVGVMSPVVIAFHAAFQAKNMLATWTWVSLSIVVGTGVFGRFVFGLIPSSHGKLDALVTLQDRWVDQRNRLRDALDSVTDVGMVRETLDRITKPPPTLSVVKLLTFVPKQRWFARAAMERVRPFFVDDAQYRFFREELGSVVKLRLQLAAYDKLKRFFRVWLALHVSLAVFMVLFIAGHVAISLYLGYAWVFGGST